MESPQDRINLLKWASKNTTKLKSLIKRYEKLMEEQESFHRLQDISLRKGFSELEVLLDRVEYLDKKIDSQRYVNDGVLVVV